MYIHPHASQNRRVLLLYATGFYLLAVAFLAPHAGYVQGQTFFQVARDSPWDRWWDWAAAWCSVKIILLSLGLSAVMAALGMMLKILRRESLGNVALLFSAGSAMGFWLGTYYLVKALL
jgi:hypothetical protein